MTRLCDWCEQPLSKNANKNRKYHDKCRVPRNKAIRKEKQRKGICVQCSKKHSGGYQRCEECLEEQRKKNKVRLEAEKKKRITAKGLCSWCKQPMATITRKPSWFKKPHFHHDCHKEQLRLFEKFKTHKLKVLDSEIERTRKALMQELEKEL